MDKTVRTPGGKILVSFLGYSEVLLRGFLFEMGSLNFKRQRKTLVFKNLIRWMDGTKRAVSDVDCEFIEGFCQNFTLGGNHMTLLFRL